MSNIKQYNIDERVYTGLQAFTVQSFTEANVKNGSQFYISEVFTLDSNTTTYIAFNTQDADTIIKFRQIATNGGLEYKVYRNPTVTYDGTNITVHNLNDKNPNSNLVTIQKNLTVTNIGDQWDIVKAFNQQGSQSGGGVFATSGVERVFNKNSDYLVEFFNTDNTEVEVHYVVSWYEGPLNIDII